MDATSASKQKALFKSCRQLNKQGEDDSVAGLLVDALRGYRLDAEGVLHAGRMLFQIDPAAGNVPRYRVSILGQCTTSWIVPALTAVARGRGQQLHVDEADYDNVLQEASVLDPKTDAVVLVPWTQRLFGESIQPAADRIGDELSFWQGVWAMLAKRGNLLLVEARSMLFDGSMTGFVSGCPQARTLSISNRFRAALGAILFMIAVGISGPSSRLATQASYGCRNTCGLACARSAWDRKKCWSSISITRSGAASWAKLAR